MSSARRIHPLTKVKRFHWKLPHSMNTTQRLLLAFMFPYADDDGGGIYVSKKTLMELTGFTERTYFRAIRALRAAPPGLDRGVLFDGGDREIGGGRVVKLTNINFELLHELSASNRPAFSQGDTVEPDFGEEDTVETVAAIEAANTAIFDSIVEAEPPEIESTARFVSVSEGSPESGLPNLAAKTATNGSAYKEYLSQVYSSQESPLKVPSSRCGLAEEGKAVRETEAAQSEAEIDRGWRQFWHVYPSSSGKVAAERNFRLAVAGKLPSKDDRRGHITPHDPVPIADLIRGAERYAEHVKRQPNGYSVKHAQGWLTDRRWRDYEDGKPAIRGSAPVGKPSTRGWMANPMRKPSVVSSSLFADDRL